MKAPGLTYYDIAPHVTAFSSTRHGGVSRGAYGSFNINPYCGDASEAVTANREALCRLLGVDDSHLLLPHQVHRTEIAVVEPDFFSMSVCRRKDMLDGIDAVMSNVPGVCFGVSTADCIPVIIYDTVCHAACVVHAGWRGTVARIAEKAVAAMCRRYGSSPQTMKAVVGPGISGDAFEVGDEVYDEFLNNGFSMDDISFRRDRWHIDLPACNHLQLVASGIPVGNIQMCGICTYHNSADYFSARKLGTASGRIFTGVVLK
ncbi:peptidoglycan editing factor PgeF [Xylanibacter caecicola]|uniref:peptidoglycan editing factor PgeF n=1 Tax=Xylanibacter caecicola TaxID=2736294 RepID=UPI0025873B72|nr:peptidoglycan editing factor PgeF [Xylanibacter caecicola]